MNVLAAGVLLACAAPACQEFVVCGCPLSGQLKLCSQQPCSVDAYCSLLQFVNSQWYMPHLCCATDTLHCMQISTIWQISVACVYTYPHYPDHVLAINAVAEDAGWPSVQGVQDAYKCRGTAVSGRLPPTWFAAVLQTSIALACCESDLQALCFDEMFLDDICAGTNRSGCYTAL